MDEEGIPLIELQACVTLMAAGFSAEEAKEAIVGARKLGQQMRDNERGTND